MKSAFKLHLLSLAVSASSIFTIKVEDWHLIDHPFVISGANVDDNISGGDYATLNVATGWQKRDERGTEKYKFCIIIKLTPKRLFWNFSDDYELAFFGTSSGSAYSMDFFGLSRANKDGRVVHKLRYGERSMPNSQDYKHMFD